ncbi:MAG: calcium-binding protein [Pseudomonadota bacterium]
MSDIFEAFDGVPRQLWVGTGHQDVEQGTGLSDDMFARAGADRVDGLGGDDLILGQRGDDTLVGGSGNDTLRGGKGDDVIESNAGLDVLVGGRGFDLLSYLEHSITGGVRINLDTGSYFGGASSTIDLDIFSGFEGVIGSRYNDDLRGDVKDNFLSGRSGRDYILGEGGHDTILGGLGRDTLVGGSGNDYIDGGVTRDVLSGNGGKDTLIGGQGRDSLNGGSGADVMDGGDKADRLLGDGGDDTMTGGNGADVFIFEPGRTDNDVITDFETGPGGDVLGFYYFRVQNSDIQTIQDVLDRAEEQNGDTLLRLSATESILLEGVLPDALSAQNISVDFL